MGWTHKMYSNLYHNYSVVMAKKNKKKTIDTSVEYTSVY